MCCSLTLNHNEQICPVDDSPFSVSDWSRFSGKRRKKWLIEIAMNFINISSVHFASTFNKLQTSSIAIFRYVSNTSG